jgi:hypothetical protein
MELTSIEEENVVAFASQVILYLVNVDQESTLVLAYTELLSCTLVLLHSIKKNKHISWTYSLPF